MSAARRARDPSDQRARRRLLRRRASASFAALVEPLKRARDAGARDGRAGSPASTFPTASATTSSSRCAIPTSTRSTRGASSRTGASTSPPPSTTRISRRAMSRTRTRCIRASRERRRLSGRAAGALQPELRPALAAGPRGGARGGPRPDLHQSRSEHRGARGRGALRLRRGAAHHRRLRGAGPAVRAGRAARRRRLCGAPRRRAACSITAIGSTTTARSLDAQIVPPTSQNQASIEDDLTAFVDDWLDLPDDELRASLRADGAQLRSLHLLRDAFPRSARWTGAETAMTQRRGGALIIGIGNPDRGDDAGGARRRGAAEGARIDGRSGDGMRRRGGRSGRAVGEADDAILIDAASRAPRRARSDAIDGSRKRRCRRGASACRPTASASPRRSSSPARSASCRAAASSTRSRAVFRRRRPLSPAVVARGRACGRAYHGRDCARRRTDDA